MFFSSSSSSPSSSPSPPPPPPDISCLDVFPFKDCVCDFFLGLLDFFASPVFEIFMSWWLGDFVYMHLILSPVASLSRYLP